MDCHQKEVEKVMKNWMKHSHFYSCSYSYSYLLLPTYLGNLPTTPFVKKMNQYSIYTVPCLQTSLTSQSHSHTTKQCHSPTVPYVTIPTQTHTLASPPLPVPAGHSQLRASPAVPHRHQSISIYILITYNIHTTTTMTYPTRRMFSIPSHREML